MKTHTFYTCIFLLQVVFVPSCVKAFVHDTIKNPGYFSSNLHYGFIIPHSKKIKDVADASPFGLDISWGKILRTEKAWKQCKCFSRAGFTMSYFSFGDTKILGHSFSLHGFYQPWLYKRNSSGLSLKTGLGLSYLSKIYDPVKNPENLFFGYPLSFLLYIQVQYELRLNNNLYCHTGISYNHISNGGIKQPNLGMNFPTAFLGVSYFPQNYLPFPKYRLGNSTFEKKGDFEIEFFSSLKNYSEKSSQKGELTFIAGCGANYIYRFSYFHGAISGLEYMYDGYKRKYYKMNALSGETDNVSLFIGHSLFFGRFQFIEQIHYSIILPIKGKKVFQRYKLYYSITESIKIGASLKASLEVADIFDIRCVVRL